MIAGRLGKFIAATAISGAVTWGVYKQHLFVEARKAIDVDYQELQVPAGRQSKSFNDVFVNYGVPVRSPDYTVYKNHVLCYNQEKKIPHWVLEVLSKENCKGSASREKINFKSDPTLSDMFASKNEDYHRSGWSRGHMAAAGNHKYDQEAMNDTFFLSNIVPQDADNNAGFWNRLENYSRDLAYKFDKVWVVSGPLFLPQTEGEKKFVKYQVIGNSEVAVPTHLFKILVAEFGKRRLIGAFVVPNTSIAKDKLLKEYQVPVEFVESKAGFQFFPRLDRKSSEDLCRVEGCQLKSWAEFELMFIRKKIESAKTLNRLEKTWKELKDKGLKPDENLIEKYNRKKFELENGGVEKLEKDAARKRG